MLVPWPREVAQLVERGHQGLERALNLAPRVAGLLGQAEGLLARIEALVSGIEDTNRRARALIVRADATVEVSDRVVQTAARLTGQLAPMVAAAEPALNRLLPLMTGLADTVTSEDVAAALRLVNDLPEIVSRLDRDILPVLDTLGTVAPDLRDLLDVSKDLNEILAALPGLGRAKRRLEDDEAGSKDAREYRAEEEPRASPDRGPQT